VTEEEYIWFYELDLDNNYKPRSTNVMINFIECGNAKFGD